MAPIMVHVTWSLILFMAVTMQFVGAQAEDGGKPICRPATAGRLKNITGAYNETNFPRSSFRSDLEADYFRAWPENITNPRFRFTCQDGSNRDLLNFTATCDETTGRLDPRPYYDVGLADHLHPYYKHWTYTEILPTTEVQLLCERNDMLNLYSHRVWRKAIIPAVVTAIVLLIILESTAVVAAFLYSWTLARSRPKLQLPHLGFEETVADCLHLLLLILAGFTMIEGVSHSSSSSWRSTCMLDAAVIYTYLTLFATLSSLLRQVASACIRFGQVASDRDIRDRDIHNNSTRSTTPFVQAPTSTDDEKGTSPKAQKAEKMLVLEPLSGDWRWMRVFNQFAVVMLMTAFLTYNENRAGTALDDLVSVIWSVIVVAGTWSIGVSLVIAARAVILLGELWSQRSPVMPQIDRDPAAIATGVAASDPAPSSPNSIQMSRLSP